MPTYLYPGTDFGDDVLVEESLYEALYRLEQAR